jgi:hypothetical protein
MTAFCGMTLLAGANAWAGCPWLVVSGPCGEFAPAVPVTTYYGTPVVQTTPGHYFGPAPKRLLCRPVCAQPKYYLPGQPLRNTLRAVTP